MEEDIKFYMNSIEKTFADYKKNNIYDGVVTEIKDNGVLFNIGGKSDAFIKKEDFEDFDLVKIGDRFKALVLGTKTEDGLIEVSKEQAENMINGSKKVENLKVGSKFTFVVNSFNKEGILSKIGPYNIIVPTDEIDVKVRHLSQYVSKQLEGIVLEIDHQLKTIIVSVKILSEQIKEQNETLFWKSAFVGKKVLGTITNIKPYGAFVDLNGVNALLHISDISYKKINNPSEVVEIGKEYEFRIIKLDKENNKISVGLKQNNEDPRITAIKNLKSSEIYKGKVTKLLPFGAIIELENGVTGLLHISDATNDNSKKIYELVHLDDEVKVGVKYINDNNTKVSFRMF